MTEIEAEMSWIGSGRRRPRHSTVILASNSTSQTVRLSPAMALLDEAEHADLVVVGSTGAGVFTRFLLGSTTGALLASSPCPVVVVPAGPQPPASRIVVGTDGSEHADHAVRWAADEADRRGGELVVVHVWKYGYHLTIGRYRSCRRLHAGRCGTDPGQGGRSCPRGQRGERSRPTGRGQRDRHAPGAAPRPPDLLVVGSRGRGGFRAMLFGSIATAAATHSNCPTVIVR